MQITGRELLEAAGPGDLAETVSVLATGEALVVTAARGLAPAAAKAAAQRLAHLPAPTVLLGEPGVTPEPLVAAADVCLTEEPDPPRPWVAADPEDLEEGVEAQPEPSLALVSVLRASVGLSIPDAIAVESAAYAALLGSYGFHDWLAKRGAARPKPHVRPPVAIEREGSRLRIWLDRPEARNAVDQGVRDDLVAALRLAELEPGMQVELRGRGLCFSSGGDLQEFGTVGDPGVAHAVRLTRHPGSALAAVADRAVCYLHGPCVGAGVEVPAFATTVVADPGTTFRLPEVSMGLIPGAGGTCSLARRIGRHRAGWLALTAATIDGPTAVAWGLVDRLEAVSGESG